MLIYRKSSKQRNPNWNSRDGAERGKVAQIEKQPFHGGSCGSFIITLPHILEKCKVAVRKGCHELHLNGAKKETKSSGNINRKGLGCFEVLARG